MLTFFIKRVLLILPTFIGITIIAFAFVRVLPGDPVLLIAGERGVTPERYQLLMTQFGYDRPKVDLLGGDKWKPVGEIKSELAAEDTNGAGPGAIGPWRAGVTNITKQVEILLHRVQCSGSWRVDSQ